MRVEFSAPEYRADQTFAEALFCFDGSAETGWRIERNGDPWLQLGPGYRLLRTTACGVCSTDLARHLLPFPLPQVTGHELVARDERDRRTVVGINASHRARGVTNGCADCASGLATHCPDRLVLGIHDLPGGFGPWILAPVQAVIEVPEGIPDSAAVLVEPFAAALNAVTTLDLSRARQVAVLGPRKLGMLVIAALRAHRDSAGQGFEILALSRNQELLQLAATLGADTGLSVEGSGDDLPDQLADVVIDTTGDPEALTLASRLARREVHVKSTHGRPAGGIARVTELVVDELALDRVPERLPDDPRRAARLGFAADRHPRVAWLAPQEPPAWLVAAAEIVRVPAAASARAALQHAVAEGELPRADFAVVACARDLDTVIRPSTEDQCALVRPRGDVLLHPAADVTDSPALAAIVRRGLRLSSSRCGDFRAALALMHGDARLLRLGEQLITHRFPATAMREAFAMAASRACIKAVIEPGDDRSR